VGLKPIATNSPSKLPRCSRQNVDITFKSLLRPPSEVATRPWTGAKRPSRLPGPPIGGTCVKLEQILEHNWAGTAHSLEHIGHALNPWNHEDKSQVSLIWPTELGVNVCSWNLWSVGPWQHVRRGLKCNYQKLGALPHWRPTLIGRNGYIGILGTYFDCLKYFENWADLLMSTVKKWSWYF
jgi:hypothetical protein